MNARAIKAATEVIVDARIMGRTADDTAAALDAAGLLNSPERAADLVRLRARITELEQAELRERTVDEDPIAYALTDKDTPPPSLDGRLDVLLEAMRTEGGEWTTHRVQKLYRTRGQGAPLRTTARKDLHALFAMGLLVEHDLRGRRHFTLARGGAR